MSRVAIALVLALFATSVWAAALPTRDMSGSKDHPQIGRLDGSVIVNFDYRAYDEATFPISKLEPKQPSEKDARNNTVMVPAQKQDAEGARTRIIYVLPPERSPLEALRNYQQEITAKGGKMLYECREDACGGEERRASQGGGIQGIMNYSLPGQIPDSQSSGACAVDNSYSGQRYGVMSFEANGVTSYVGVHTFISEGDRDCTGFANRTVAIVTVVEVKPRQQTIVTISGEALAKDISATGRAAVYGIFFDFDKAIVKTDSKPQLDEIAKMLRNNPQLRVLIVGHTDNKGGASYNQTLSEQRARAVVDALIKTYGVVPNRLSPMGAGMTSPVASNDTEEGQAKNRRVEIVKM